MPRERERCASFRRTRTSRLRSRRCIRVDGDTGNQGMATSRASGVVTPAGAAPRLPGSCRAGKRSRLRRPRRLRSRRARPGWRGTFLLASLSRWWACRIGERACEEYRPLPSMNQLETLTVVLLANRVSLLTHAHSRAAELRAIFIVQGTHCTPLICKMR